MSNPGRLYRSASHFCAMAMPTLVATPCPSGPVVVSTPETQWYSGCPGALLSSWRKRRISSSDHRRLPPAARSRDSPPGSRSDAARTRAASRRGRSRARTDRGWARSGPPDRSASPGSRSCTPEARAPSACRVPDLACCTASIESVRIVLIASWSSLASLGGSAIARCTHRFVPVTWRSSWATLLNRRTCRGAWLKRAARNVSTSSQATLGPTVRPPIQSEFMSSSSTPCSAEK